MSFKFNHSNDGKQLELDAKIEQLVIAGWTGRDAGAVEAHIRELEAMNIPRPKTTPIFYRGWTGLLTSADSIEVIGEETSGEVEPVLLNFDDTLWVGVGSDHTDRRLESYSVTLAKQICAKPLGRDIWRYDDVAVHWDNLIMRSYIIVEDKKELYQEGTLDTIKPVEELVNMHYGEAMLPADTVFYCGTVSVIGDIRPAQKFHIELEDPVLKRSLYHQYSTFCLPSLD